LTQKESQHLFRVLAFGGSNGPLGLVERAQAPSAYVKPPGGLAVLDGHALNIRQPTTFCSLF
jgi:hypothetical protein